MRGRIGTHIFTRCEATKTSLSHGVTLLVNVLCRTSCWVPLRYGAGGIQLPDLDTVVVVSAHPTVPTGVASQRAPEVRHTAAGTQNRLQTPSAKGIISLAKADDETE